MTVSLLTRTLLPEYLNVDSYRMPQFHPSDDVRYVNTIPLQSDWMVGLLDELSSTASSETMIMLGCVVAVEVGSA